MPQLARARPSGHAGISVPLVDDRKTKLAGLVDVAPYKNGPSHHVARCFAFCGFAERSLQRCGAARRCEGDQPLLDCVRIPLMHIEVRRLGVRLSMCGGRGGPWAVCGCGWQATDGG